MQFTRMQEAPELIEATFDLLDSAILEYFFHVYGLKPQRLHARRHELCLRLLLLSPKTAKLRDRVHASVMPCPTYVIERLNLEPGVLA